ncbi:hypothetical protein [Rhizobium sp. No.120]
MQQKYHPDRYHQAMSAAMSRIESLAANAPADGTAGEKSLAIEFEGMSEAEMGERSSRLDQIERLIAGWAANGHVIFDAEETLNELALSEPAPFDLDAELFVGGIGYIHFGKIKGLQSQSDPRTHVEGTYIRHAELDDVPGYELTFVCNEPGWSTLKDAKYGDAIRTASCVATAFVALDQELPCVPRQNMFRGDPALIADDVLARAFGVAIIALAILSARENKPTVQAVPLRH